MRPSRCPPAERRPLAPAFRVCSAPDLLRVVKSFQFLPACPWERGPGLVTGRFLEEALHVPRAFRPANGERSARPGELRGSLRTLLDHGRRRGRLVTSPAMRAAPFADLAAFLVDDAREAPAVARADERVGRLGRRRQRST